MNEAQCVHYAVVCLYIFIIFACIRDGKIEEWKKEELAFAHSFLPE